MSGELRDAARAEHAQPKATPAALLKDEVARLSDELAAACDERDRLAAQVDNMGRRLAESEAARREAVQQYEKARDYGTRLAAELEAVDALVAEASKVAAAHKQVVTGLAVERDELLVKLTAAQERAATALNEQARKQELADGYRRERDEAQAAATEANGVKNGALQARDSLARELEQVKAHAARQNDRITTLDDEQQDAIAWRDLARQRIGHLTAKLAARDAAVAHDIEKAREQVRKTKAEKAARSFRRSRSRERHAAALARLAALEAVAGRWQS